jgi:hypothetical protein
MTSLKMITYNIIVIKKLSINLDGKRQELKKKKKKEKRA